MKSKGFTLIELLVVLAIVAILVAIIFPVFSSAREKARQATCSSNLRQLGLAVEQYIEDYDEVLPGAYQGDYGIDTSHQKVGGWIYYVEFAEDNPRGKDFYPELGAIYPYVKNAQVFLCPDDGIGQKTGDSYAINSCVDNPPDQSTYYASGKLLAKLDNPTGMMLFSEEDDPAVGSTNDGYLNLNYEPGEGDTLATRHNNGVEVQFVDGHVKWVRTDQVHPLGLQTGIPGEVAGESVCPK